jgi:hypothetical protein
MANCFAHWAPVRLPPRLPAWATNLDPWDGQDWWSGGEEGRGRRRTVMVNDRWYQAPDQPCQRLRIIPAADAHPVNASQVDLDVVPGGRCRRSRPRLRDNLYGQKARLLRPGQSQARVRRITGIAQPLEDQIGIHSVAPRHLCHRNTRRSRLETDRPLLLVGPKPLRPTRHAITIVSTIDGGHYPPLSARGRAVRPDAYPASSVVLVSFQTPLWVRFPRYGMRRACLVRTRHHQMGPVFGFALRWLRR